jgi:hypothetical protein
MSSLLQLLMILARVVSNFGQPLVIHVVYPIFVHQVPNHSCALNGEMTHFYEDRLGCISFNFEIISYTILLDLLYLSRGFK